MISLTVLKASNNNTNLETNTALRRLVDEALAQNIPKATLDKVLKRSKNDVELATEFLFEIRGPGRTAVVVECLAKSKGLLPVKINPILRKHGSVEEKGVVNMFVKEMDKSNDTSPSSIFFSFLYDLLKCKGEGLIFYLYTERCHNSGDEEGDHIG